MMADPEQRYSKKSGVLYYLGWIGAVVVVLIVLAGLVLAHSLNIERQTGSLVRQESLGPLVTVVPVQKAPTTRDIIYPGDIHGYFESPIYPKVAGYVKSMLVDKGVRVKRGQLLAVIVSPELDRQVASALANYQIAKITDDRFQTLVRQQVVSQQQADQTHATMLADKATWNSLRAQQNYERVTAPFDGVVTARNVDPGALVAMATAQQSAVPMLSMATLEPVRVYVNLPQDDAAFVKDGDPAHVTVSQFPDRKFTGSVTRHPEALTPASRTMLVEIDLPNRNQLLLPGMYAHVDITLHGNSSTPLVPDDSLVFNNGKTYVPVVRNDHIHLTEVQLGFDNGIMSQIVHGLNGSEMVAVNLGQVARDGQLVRPVPESQNHP